MKRKSFEKNEEINNNELLNKNSFVNRFFCEDCISGARRYLPDACIDLLICDPPYGINGSYLDKHYNRSKNKLIDGYVDIPIEKYEKFSREWIAEASRVLRPDGTIFIISGYSNLLPILEALEDPKNNLVKIRHFIWKYNFGVWTTRKFVSSHYHILYYKKSIKNPNSNTNLHEYGKCESIWIIPREYHVGEIRNKNQLPTSLLQKLVILGLSLSSSSSTNSSVPIVADFFLGSFSTARVALEMGCNVTGFEINEEAFKYWEPKIREKLKNNKYSIKKFRSDNSKLPIENSYSQKSLVIYPFIYSTNSASASSSSSSNSCGNSGSNSYSDGDGDGGSGSGSGSNANLPILPSSEKSCDVHLIICWPSIVPTKQWLNRVESRLCPGGSLYLVTSVENLSFSLSLLKKSSVSLKEVNHIIWQYSNRDTSQEETYHHILFYEKPGSTRYFNPFAIYDKEKRFPNGKSANYTDREDVWTSTLDWVQVVTKIIHYSSCENHIIASFCEKEKVVKEVAKKLNRKFIYL